MKLAVGQKLWLVPTRGYGHEREITIERVGRKWAYFDRDRRLDPTTLKIDGGELDLDDAAA